MLHPQIQRSISNLKSSCRNKIRSPELKNPNGYSSVTNTKKIYEWIQYKLIEPLLILLCPERSSELCLQILARWSLSLSLSKSSISKLSLKISTKIKILFQAHVKLRSKRSVDKPKSSEEREPSTFTISTSSDDVFLCFF